MTIFQERIDCSIRALVKCGPAVSTLTILKRNSPNSVILHENRRELRVRSVPSWNFFYSPLQGKGSLGCHLNSLVSYRRAFDPGGKAMRRSITTGALVVGLFGSA
jgi:hypothetical protein